jgi:hypothetical protein
MFAIIDQENMSCAHGTGFSDILSCRRDNRDRPQSARLMARCGRGTPDSPSGAGTATLVFGHHATTAAARPSDGVGAAGPVVMIDSTLGPNEPDEIASL